MGSQKCVLYAIVIGEPKGKKARLRLECRLPTAAARVRAQVRSCGIYGGRSGTGADFLRVLRFPLPIVIPPTAPHSSSSIIRGWYNRPISGRRTKWTQSPHRKKLKKLGWNIIFQDILERSVDGIQLAQDTIQLRAAVNFRVASLLDS
jgi:hypothetical protein